MDSRKTFAEEKPDDVMQSLQQVRDDLKARDESYAVRAKRRGSELIESARSLSSSIRERASEKLTSLTAAVQRQLEQLKAWYASKTTDDEVKQH